LKPPIRSPVADWVTVAELDRDPYPIYARLREQTPVAYVPAVNVWMLTRWVDVERAAGDPERFSAAAPNSPVECTFGSPTVLTCDGPLHRDMRASIDPKFRPREVDDYIDPLVRPIAVELVERIAGLGEAELMASYLEPVSVLSLGAVLGLADVDAATLRRWFAGLASGATNYELDADKQAVGDGTVREIHERLDERIERLRVAPDDSAISQMLHAGRASGAPRSLAEIMPNLLVILLGGMQEPGHGAGSALWALLSAPGAVHEVIADPDRLLDAAVDEGLRLVAPIGSQLRASAVPIELDGVTIPSGEPVALMIARPTATRRASTIPIASIFTVPGSATARSVLDAISVQGTASLASRFASPSRYCSSACPTSRSTPSARWSSAAGSFAPRSTCTYSSHRADVSGLRTPVGVAPPLTVLVFVAA
jgi:cytochrome P450